MFINWKILKNLIELSVPILAGNLSMILIGIGDVYVAGQYATDILAATGVGNAIFHPILVGGLGLCFGISPLLAIKLGNQERIDQFTRTLITYGLVIGICLTLVLQILIRLPLWGAIDEQLVPQIITYLGIVSLGLVPTTLFQVVKEYLQAQEQVRLSNILLFLSAVLNIFLNFLWIPEHGIAGLAYAQVVTRYLILIFLLAMVFNQKSFNLSAQFDWIFAKGLLKFSVPIALTLFIEVGAFAFTSYLAGVLGIVSAAAHNIVLNIASASFMIPSSLGQAISIKVGASFGANNKELLKSYCHSALVFTFFTMLLISSALYFSRNDLPGLFTQDQKVTILCAEIMVVVAIFQLFDGMQALLSGILRGMGRTLAINFVILFSFLLIGMPLSYFLAISLGIGVIGLWSSLAASLLFACIGLYFLYRSTFHQFLIR